MTKRWKKYCSSLRCAALLFFLQAQCCLSQIAPSVSGISVPSQSGAQRPQSSQNSSPDSAQAAANQPVLRFGFDKLVNTFLFRADASGMIPLFGGELLFRQTYRGSVIRTSSPAVRDDADVLLRYERPLSTVLSFVLTGNAMISADSRSIGLNRLQQFALGGGALYKPLETLRLSLTTGGEYNEQLGVADRGWNASAQAALANQRFDEYVLSADLNALYSALSNARTNAQTNMKFGVSRSFDDGGLLDFSGQYTGLRRDFYTFVGSQTASVGIPPSVETRAENLWRINARVAVPIVRSPDASIDAEAVAFFESWTIGRLFRSPVEQATFTSVQRTVEQSRLSATATVRAMLQTSVHALNVAVDTRDETNIVSERFMLPATDVQTLRNAERQRDNISIRTTLSAQSLWQIGTRAGTDTLRFDYATSLLRYDTPSETNNDDRDELVMNTSAAYTHQFSQWFTGTLFAETRLVHLVFIKAQRSAQNNWNRIFRLSPSFVYASEGFSARPQFEVLANYTSFDFEDVLTSAQSFSFRQVSYRDSLVWRLDGGGSVESRMIFRYFERGEFRWREFAETPRDRNYEVFVRVLAFAMPRNTMREAANISQNGECNSERNALRVGIGARFYTLSQQAASSAVRVPEFLNRTIGPEVSVEIPFASGTSIRFNGWYEFQFDRVRLVRQIPNVTLSTIVPL